MNATLDASVIISFCSLGLGLFFLLYLAVNRRFHTWPNFVLSLIIGVVCLECWNALLIQSQLIYEFPWFFKLGGKLNLLLYTLVLFYVGSITGHKGFRNPLIWLIFIPFFVDLFSWLPGTWSFSPAEKLAMIDQFYADTRPGPRNIWLSGRLILLHFLVPLTYLCLAAYWLIHYEHRQQRSKKVSRRLLLVLLIGLLLFLLLGQAFAVSLYRYTGQSFIDWTVELLQMSFVSVLMAFFLLRQMEITRNPEQYQDQVKYRSAGLSAPLQQDILSRLTALLKEDKCYLDQELSLAGLSKEMKVNGSYLSRAINDGLNQSFSDLVNSYRVAEAKALLSNPEYDKYTIEAIAGQAGFRSRSAFYQAFQKVEGISPASFKKQRS